MGGSLGTGAAVTGANVTDSDSNPNDSILMGTISSSGEYYAVIEANSGAGPLATYLLDINIEDDVAPKVTNVTGLPTDGATS